MSASHLCLLMTALLPAAEQSIDDFHYADSQAAQATWTAGAGTPTVQAVAVAGETMLEVSAPFGTNRDLQRTIIDRQADLNLVVPSCFELRLATNRPEACSQVSLYFRSGDGWYSGSGRLVETGWKTLHFDKHNFRIEGTPAGWDRVDGIRISFWRTADKDAAVRIAGLKALWSELAIVVPSPEATADDGELRTARSVAERTATWIRELGLDCDVISDQEPLSGGLKRRKLAILAYHPAPNGAMVQSLVDFVHNGGKVFACYTLPSPLGKAIGVGRGSYYRQERPGQFAKVRFDKSARRAIPGLPPSMRQASWNIVDAKSLSDDVRVAGLWHDDTGNPTGQAALAIGPRGAFFSHILLDDDPEAKRAMLAAVLGYLDPSLWRRMAEVELQRANRIGHLDSIPSVRDFVRSSGVKDALPPLEAAERTYSEATAALAAAPAGAEASRYTAIVELARQARQSFADAYLRAQPSPEVEGRAVWNHSGTGAYAGQWERSAKQLAAAGFNMVIPNMLWGGRAHYASNVLPRSRTFEQYGDQIAQCVAACKPYGIEVHVWKVNWNLSGAPPEFVERMHREGRTQVTAEGQPQNWLCPSHPENQQLELESMLEVARNYDVDGLHFDYIRYPNGNCCYCDACRQRFETAVGEKIENWPTDCYQGRWADRYRDWRCEQITRLVANVHREAKRIKPQIKISAAVFGAYPDCRRSVGQDWPLWIKNGYLDFVCPMDYTGSDAKFQSLVENQLRRVEGKIPVYPGIGATASRVRLTADRVAGQIYYARSLGAAGFTIFNFHPGTAEEIIPKMAIGVGRQPARPPH